MRLPISKESAFVIGIGLIGFPLYTLWQSKLAAYKEQQARQQRARPRSY